MDWNMYSTVYYNEEVTKKKKEYYTFCRETLLREFGESGIF